MAQERSRVFGVVRGAVFTVAGLADVAHRQAQQVLAGLSLVAPPPDAEDGSLQSRGSALLRRWTTPPEHHMEAMARQVARAKDPGHG